MLIVYCFPSEATYLRWSPPMANFLQSFRRSIWCSRMYSLDSTHCFSPPGGNSNFGGARDPGVTLRKRKGVTVSPRAKTIPARTRGLLSIGSSTRSHVRSGDQVDLSGWSPATSRGNDSENLCAPSNAATCGKNTSYRPFKAL